MGEPVVSVVVPVRNRRQLLSELLNALDKQTYDNFEVIVVDDGSSDGSGAEASDRIIAGGPVRLLAATGRGAVEARIQGAAVAAGSILAFTDSDCVPSPGWIEAGVAEIDRGADVVNGVTRPARPMQPGERSIASGREGLYPTCNLFFRRSAFESAGGFDPDAAARLGFRADARARGLGFGEDTLLAWRVRRSGKAAFAPDAIVEHHVFPAQLAESVSRWWMAAAFPALVREVPELRGTLVFHGYQLGRRTRVPVYATAVSLATRRKDAAAVSFAVWAALRLSELRSAPVGWVERIRALPIVMLGDVVTAAALVIGSARARRPLI